MTNRDLTDLLMRARPGAASDLTILPGGRQRGATSVTRTLSANAVLLDSLTIPGQAEHLRAVRSFVARALGPGTDTTEVATLLASELVANSMQHSDSGRDGGTITVRLLAIPGGLRAEVIDAGGVTVPALQGSEQELAERGRGLTLVQALATRWDYARYAAGTLTWFELAVPPGSHTS